MKNLVFTICSNNYLSQAVVLGKSLLAHNSSYQFKIGLVDKKTSVVDYTVIPFDVIEAETLQIEGWDEMVMRYSIVELNTAVKPFFMQYFMQEDVDAVMYFDPDILVYKSFVELEKQLEQNDIVVIPHTVAPIPMDTKKPQEEELLNSGIYNLGFIAVKKSAIGSAFLNWWSERLREKAYIAFDKGMFTDQIWINFVPLFFEQVHILRDAGYNVAYWNLHERFVSSKGDMYFIQQNESNYPLTFFHFSGYSPLRPQILSKYQNRFHFEEREKELCELFENYQQLLLHNGYETYVNIPCYYVDFRNSILYKKRKQYLCAIPKWRKALRMFANWLYVKFDLNY